MATHGHTLKAFDQELEELRVSISQMGGLAELAIRDSIQRRRIRRPQRRMITRPAGLRAGAR